MRVARGSEQVGREGKREGRGKHEEHAQHEQHGEALDTGGQPKDESDVRALNAHEFGAREFGAREFDVRESGVRVRKG